MALLLSTRHRRRRCAIVDIDIDISGAYDSDSNKPGPRSDWPPILNLHAASRSPPFSTHTSCSTCWAAVVPVLANRIWFWQRAANTDTSVLVCVWVCVRSRHAQPLCQPAALHGLWLFQQLGLAIAFCLPPSTHPYPADCQPPVCLFERITNLAFIWLVLAIIKKKPLHGAYQLGQSVWLSCSLVCVAINLFKMQSMARSAAREGYRYAAARSVCHACSEYR